MPQVSPFEIINKICKEAELFDSKDRLLNFSTKGDFQTPLVLEAGDLFYEKWIKSGEPISLDTFLPIGANFTPQQKTKTEEQFCAVFREKAEDFLNPDLYLLLGFLKWDGNALAPSLLIPLDVSPDQHSLTLSNRPPIENVILRKRLAANIQLPRVEDATINGTFSILLYFSLFEKAIAQEKKWKFTRHGLCLAFFNTNRLLLKKRLERGFSEKETSNSPFLSDLLGAEGFKFKESVFEEADFNQVFNPADHHFLYPTDSHTTKVTIDALDEKSDAYAIQALPGTSKIKVVSNIVAESLAQKKRTLVVAKRSISKLNFSSALRPAFRSFDGPERSSLEQDIRKSRESFSAYYNTVNRNLETAQAPLSEVLQEFLSAPAGKTKIPESVFQGISGLSLEQFKVVKDLLNQVTSEYMEHGGVQARKAFSKVKISNLDEATKNELAKELGTASAQVEEIKPVIKIFEHMGLFPAGIFLSALADTLELVQKNFDENTPEFENWELRSSNWVAYQSALKQLPEAGDSWVRYRRQTSDIYTDNAVDENILAIRDEFADSLKATLKGLSDHYRNSRKRLISLIRNPKSVGSDEELLDLIDTLIELQENKRTYKDTSVLGAHLLGKDWLYEKSNWVEINKKITFFYDFHEKHQNDARLELLLLLLENWHEIKPLLKDLDKHTQAVQTLLAAVRHITKSLGLETPLESLTIDKWLNELEGWNSNWANLDTHLKISDLLQQLSSIGCVELVNFISNPDSISKDLPNAFVHFWAGYQIQQASKICPDLFTLSPKNREEKSKNYRTLLDQLCNANFRDIHSIMDSSPECLKIASLDETLCFDKEQFDVAIILDADCITVAEALPAICCAAKVILVGDPHAPSIEPQPFDAYPNILPRQSAFFMENILAATLRRGIPTRELWFVNNYSDISLVNFANGKIYNNGIKQLPRPIRENSRNESLKVVPDKIMAVAKAAIQHAERKPGQTLGIIASQQSQCFEIEATIRSLLSKNSPARAFFNQSNPLTRYYIKTPDRATDKYRDTLLVCTDVEGFDKAAAERKLSVCSTLAKQELQVFVNTSDLEKRKTSKGNLFWDWIGHLEKTNLVESSETIQTDSIIKGQIMDTLKAEGFVVEPSFGPGGIALGPVVADANYTKRFLAVIEDDCTTERFRESIEDREYIRPTVLHQLGWTVLNIWLPFWYMAAKDEREHLTTTIAIEQSVAPPPPENDETKVDQDFFEEGPTLNIVPYQVLFPKIAGTAHEKPIAELPVQALIAELKFFIDHEAPIHEEILFRRVLELHHVDRIGPMLQQALVEAVKQGIQRQKFIKTGKFFYSTKNPPVELRNRSERPETERKLSFVSPEERSLLPSSMNESSIKQTLGLLE